MQVVVVMRMAIIDAICSAAVGAVAVCLRAVGPGLRASQVHVWAAVCLLLGLCGCISRRRLRARSSCVVSCAAWLRLIPEPQCPALDARHHEHAHSFARWLRVHAACIIVEALSKHTILAVRMGGRTCRQRAPAGPGSLPRPHRSGGCAADAPWG
jgi:hypothetical protein